MPDAPATWEEVEAIGQGLVADGTVSLPLVVQQATADPYHNYPLFTGMGGYVFGQAEDGSYDPNDLGIDSEGGLAAAEKFAEWSESGLISSDIDYGVMIESFSTGDTPFAITGPWATGDFTDAGVNFVVEPVPPIEAGGGATPNVFVGVQGFMISSFSESPDLATTFVLDFLGTEAVQLDLFDAGGRPPAMTSAFDQVSDDPLIQGFGLSGQAGAPLPNIPAMSAVWSTWTDAYTLIFQGSDPVESFTTAAETIRSDIAAG